MLLTDFSCTAAEFESATGWAIKPEGACKADVCVPLGPDAGRNGGAGFDLPAAADKLGMAVVHDPDLGVWAVGPETLGGRALASAEAPDLRLPDLDGNELRLSSLRGKKVALAAWAPW